MGAFAWSLWMTENLLFSSIHQLVVQTKLSTTSGLSQALDHHLLLCRLLPTHGHAYLTDVWRCSCACKTAALYYSASLTRHCIVQEWDLLEWGWAKGTSIYTPPYFRYILSVLVLWVNLFWIHGIQGFTGNPLSILYIRLLSCIMSVQEPVNAAQDLFISVLFCTLFVTWGLQGWYISEHVTDKQWYAKAYMNRKRTRILFAVDIRYKILAKLLPYYITDI